MKKTVLFILVSVFVTACAGNPPAWWNPRNMQPGQTTASPDRTTKTVRPATSAEVPVNMDAEELISVPDEGYEEMQLTPIQDEEQENVSGESAAQLTEEDTLTPSILEE